MNDPIALAHQLVRDDVPRAEAAVALAGAVEHRRDVLELAHLRQLDDMHQLPSSDLEATAVLRLLLAALARTPWAAA